MPETFPLRVPSRFVVRRALATAVVVGSTLTLVNQSALLMNGPIRVNDLARMATNYLIPFLVSVYSAHASAPRGALPQSEE